MLDSHIIAEILERERREREEQAWRQIQIPAPLPQPESVEEKKPERGVEIIDI